jgi:ABC-type bacteriocin/lantibiotic exporter with double-glycine peptidase domain
MSIAEVISICAPTGATPLFRQRLDVKFQRGAENQAFLVESVTGVETLKSMAVEPQMQRRWEEQLAGYVAASFKVVSLGNTGVCCSSASSRSRCARASFSSLARPRPLPPGDLCSG